jgi:hypothetical protein
MDNHLPNLVNLNEDPQLSEMLLYMVKEGVTTVGKHTPSSSHDIQLSGVLIADDHWYVRPPAGDHPSLSAALWVSLGRPLSFKAFIYTDSSQCLFNSFGFLRQGFSV